MSMKRKQKRPRKPKDWDKNFCHTDVYFEQFAEPKSDPKIAFHVQESVFGDDYDNAKDCRKLAAWLLKAADYLEWKEK